MAHGTQPLLRPARPSLHRQRQGLPQQDLRDRPDPRNTTWAISNCNIASNSVIQLFNVTVHHATPITAGPRPWSDSSARWRTSTSATRQAGAAEARRNGRRTSPASCGTSWSMGAWTMDQFTNGFGTTSSPPTTTGPTKATAGANRSTFTTPLPRARMEQPAGRCCAWPATTWPSARSRSAASSSRTSCSGPDEMIGLAGTDAVIRYSRSDLSSVSVMVDSKFLCEAGLHRDLLAGGRKERIAAHVGKQKKQMRETRFRIAVASRSAFADRWTPRRTWNDHGHRIQKAARAREAARQKPPTQAARRQQRRRGALHVRGNGRGTAARPHDNRATSVTKTKGADTMNEHENEYRGCEICTAIW